MRQDSFQVRPVARYDGARYPGVGQAEPDDGAPEERRSPLALLCALVLVVGLTVGLVGCYMRSDYVPDDPRPPTPDGGPDPDCLPDALRCTSPTLLETCEDGRWVGRDCDALCVERSGGMAYSLGCDAAAPDPCRCEYDVLDGAAPACSPGDLYCADDRTLARCTEGYVEVHRDCDELCFEERGAGWVSAGCDAAAEDPCRCFYDVLDGEMAVCTPEDLYCEDDGTVWLCEEYELVRHDCAELCEERLGPGAESAGCDGSSLEDPCRCRPAGER